MKILHEHIEEAAASFADSVIKHLKSGELDMIGNYTFDHGYFLKGKRIVDIAEVEKFAKDHWTAYMTETLADDGVPF